ncbi:major facilitator superfamily domain-containing protein [Pseudomassariella vexata]|uniref:Major facilitator superfamily domain-containing protein n=1 Tax=Pseudomassariella vexata TaxID=1141098 RepID=A0A1Y2EFS4_9PEZI|nr:major facilitator superfamily domain-containing protein [Pseudomassariella vexata]ORY70267.1 major facilitator superfamily domain-containing protein [Pseudomassariella vexata]
MGEKDETAAKGGTLDADAAQPTTAPNSEPPDGGWEAWLVVFGSMIVLIHTWGLVNSFGVFQTYYETELLPTSSSSDISWIGSLQAALLMMGGVVSGPLFDAGYFRALLLSGLFFVEFGTFMTSLCTSYWQIVLAQGICVGLGCALMFLPSAAILGHYFVKKRAFAFGVQSVGSPIAGIVLPIIFGRLQPQIGFAWTTRVIGFILTALAAIPVVFMKTRVPPRAHTRAFDKSALYDWPFLIFSFGGFLAFVGLYVPFFYLQLWSIDHEISSLEFSPYFVTLLNAGSIFGRLIPNYIADYAGSVNVLIIITFLAATLDFAWLGITNFPGAVSFAILYGAFSGGVVGVLPSALVPLIPDLSRFGTWMGMCFFASGLSVLVGTPIGGAILGQGGEAAWKRIIAYSGAMLLAGGLTWTLSLFLHRRRQLRARKT